MRKQKKLNFINLILVLKRFVHEAPLVFSSYGHLGNGL
jgi:hypothetical protein